MTAVITALKPQDLRVWELSRHNLLIGFVPRAGTEGVSPQAILSEIAGFLVNPMERIGEGETARVFVEGGARLVTSFLRAGLVDRIEWFRAPIILGDKGRPAFGALETEGLDDAPRFRGVNARAIGDDLWETYERVSASGSG